jgi:hypothetical protein
MITNIGGKKHMPFSLCIKVFKLSGRFFFVCVASLQIKGMWIYCLEVCVYYIIIISYSFLEKMVLNSGCFFLHLQIESLECHKHKNCLYDSKFKCKSFLVIPLHIYCKPVCLPHFSFKTYD